MGSAASYLREDVNWWKRSEEWQMSRKGFWCRSKMIHEDCSWWRGEGQGRVQLIGAFRCVKEKKENFFWRSQRMRSTVIGLNCSERSRLDTVRSCLMVEMGRYWNRSSRGQGTSIAESYLGTGWRSIPVLAAAEPILPLGTGEDEPELTTAFLALFPWFCFQLSPDQGCDVVSSQDCHRHWMSWHFCKKEKMRKIHWDIQRTGNWITELGKNTNSYPTPSISIYHIWLSIMLSKNTAQESCRLTAGFIFSVCVCEIIISLFWKQKIQTGSEAIIYFIFA